MAILTRFVATIPDDKVQEVRDRVDIVDLIGRYVDLRRAGRNYKGLCPFHQEKSPSFNVNPQRKGYKCFGCGAGGDALGFVMDMEGKSFPEAVRKLAELYGVILPAASARGHDDGRAHEKDDAYAIMRRTSEFYTQLLFDDERAKAGRDYLATRGITSEIARTFALGYAPAPSEAGWDTLVRALADVRGGVDMAEKLGLVGRSERTGNRYDRFRGRLMFPVIQPGGEVIAFSGRIVPPHDSPSDASPAPKYINSSESLLFTKGKMLFGLATARPAIRAQRRAIIVEGNFDVVKLHLWGHGETVAPLGTALTPEQARLIARFAEQVVMCFDGDAAGKKAAWAALPLLLEADLDVRMVLLPEGEDPDSIGAERFGSLLGAAKPALEEMMVRIAARAGDAAHARARGLDRVIPLIAQVPRDSARELYADRASELFRTPRSRVDAALRASMKARAEQRSSGQTTQENSRRFPSTSAPPMPLSAPVRPLPPLPAGQAQLAMLLVDVPHLANLAERTGALECVIDERLSPILHAIVEGAKRGEDPDMAQLLDRVDPAAQTQVYEGVFAGRYRTEQGVPADPQGLLHSLVGQCRKEALELRIKQIDRSFAEARDNGLPDQARQLQQEKLELRRQQLALQKQMAESSSADTSAPRK